MRSQHVTILYKNHDQNQNALKQVDDKKLIHYKKFMKIKARLQCKSESPFFLLL